MTKLVGLTGGIASGKSTVSNLLRLSGYPIIDADEIVRQLQTVHSKGLDRLTGVFGNQILNPDQSLNRRALGEIVFSDPAKLAQLNSIMQPLVREEIWRQIKIYQSQGLPYVILDIPLLFETHYAEDCDIVIVVSVSPKIQLQRLIHRDHYPEDQAKERITAQMPLTEKVQLADVVINNDGTEEELKRQVAKLVEQMHNKML